MVRNGWQRKRAKVRVRAQGCKGDQRVAGHKHVKEDRDHDDPRKDRDEHPDALEEETEFYPACPGKDERQNVHDCEEPDIAGHCHGKNEGDHRDQFYAWIQALQQTFALCDAVIYQTFLKKCKDVRDRLLDKTLFLADADRAAGAGAGFDLLHPFRYHGISCPTAPPIVPKKAETGRGLNTGWCYDYNI